MITLSLLLRLSATAAEISPLARKQLSSCSRWPRKKRASPLPYSSWEQETLRLKAKVGDLMMRNELYEMAFDRLGVPIPFGARRSSK